MARLQWQTTKTLDWKEYSIPCAETLQLEFNRGTGLGQMAGVRPDTPRRLALKRFAVPFHRLFVHTLNTGFILRGVGRWMRKYATAETDFLDVGCGAMELRRYLPKGCVYNAIEMAFSEHVMRNVIARDRNINVAFALATDIPLKDNSVSMVTATEVFEHIPPIDEAIREIRRIMRPGGKLLCSIPNNFYHKYMVMGENPDHINKWTFDGFVDYMAGHGFRVLERYRIGYWVPLKHRRLNIFYLPFTPKQEYYTSNFLYAFELDKPSATS